MQVRLAVDTPVYEYKKIIKNDLYTQGYEQGGKSKANLRRFASTKYSPSHYLVIPTFSTFTYYLGTRHFVIRSTDLHFKPRLD